MADLLAPIKNARDIMNGIKAPEQLGIEMPDSHTLIIRLQQPSLWFIQVLSHPIAFPVFATSLINHKDRAFSAEHLISNGAWQLQQWVPYEKLLLKRNTSYYDDE